MFKAETLDAVGGRLYPWQNGPHAKSGRGGGVPMAGTPSHAVVATERCLRFSHCECTLRTEDSITVFNLRVDPRLLHLGTFGNTPRSRRPSACISDRSAIAGHRFSPGDVRGPLLHPTRLGRG
jgi:hypothetical protein